MFPNFFGNADVANQLGQMAEQGRIPQTMLLSGPEGVGKATLARRFAAALLGSERKIEADDLSLEENAGTIVDREKWTAEKRNEDPLLFSTHPDFVTFPPDGPMRQLSIPQMRALRERAQYQPLHGKRRVFLIDHIDRANEQAANSLLKTLEEPPPHLIILMTAENPYDLLATIRSRAVMFQMAPLTEAEMAAYVKSRGLIDPERRIALAAGSPGAAYALDLEEYSQQRAAMVTLLEAACGVAPFSAWAKISESLAARRQERLEQLLKVLGFLLEDILLMQHGAAGIRNRDIDRELRALASRVSFQWLRSASEMSSQLLQLVKRNIQKNIALDAFVAEMRRI